MLDATREDAMVISAVLTTLCTVGVAFYVRFIVALCKECKRSWIGLLLRQHPDTGNYTICPSSATGELFEEAA